ncbi:NH(3)-dependent NAD(+) synthetase [Fusobacterium sp. DD29]|uniref:NAD+ synthase n=1 Tax=unclassified Fusobacterium TaxID=2648384 RepID=UPI001B8AA7F3|nr:MULTISPECIES: NAD+ synthase [unclassified Fusobacterium]MBR8701199.1 NH(3)-dependent NAD(+) synthetase [Fusobacterium sp. DD45]MBR8710965.1 NH(3)-dependent NAD(+) synthetase [Fusobacterium sp. DD28]MBR8749938.1 NH(3)-dependent NAD(+) synthetase [Fusobacterium sp. DD29]MBR8751539.1 NH(3)-dependent NAD(+) synthetase [Fusobacterium sp. DD26]MBR8762180.1 NH(3)-dependent NAD(+) synthetase [Fusobacterium sp. DD25]
MNKFSIDLNVLEDVIVDFLREEAGRVGFKKVVLGLSGGIDSALVAFLAAKAFGPENVLGIMMPYKSSSKESVEHAKLVIEKTGIRSKTVEITPMVEAYFAMNPDMDSLRKGNKMARERMSILFDHSAAERALVLGTSNKTEVLLGYSTQFGDSAAALEPIGDLYKTVVWDLSRHMGVPSELIDKKPSADLWEGQTDEQDLGYSYKMADEILYRLLEERKTPEEISEEGFDIALIKKIIKRVKMMQYKRVMPVTAKVTDRTPGLDFKYPRDWGV